MGERFWNEREMGEVCPVVSVLIAADIVINVECSVRPLGAIMGEDANMLPIQFSQADILT